MNNRFITQLRDDLSALSSENLLKPYSKLECGPMPNVMVSQPNIGGALCESSVVPFLLLRRSLADARQ